ncbi:hypothetical protein GGS24DRAFT_510572 [Hypoxylon argillaceum]|nr:hypothetical protein GGS24DRAFT_510572 [Hypoxylon argillaceum]
MLSLPRHPLAFAALVIGIACLASWADMLLPLFGTVVSGVADIYAFNVHPTIGVLTFLVTSLILSFAFVASSRLLIVAALLQSLLVAYTDYGWWTFSLGLTAYRLWTVGLLSTTLQSIPELCLFLCIKLHLSFPENKPTIRDKQGRVRRISFKEHRARFPYPPWSSFLWSSDIKLDWITPWVDAYQYFRPSTVLGLQTLCLMIAFMIYATGQVMKDVVWRFSRNPSWCPDWRVAKHKRQEEERLAQLQREKDSMPLKIIYPRYMAVTQQSCDEHFDAEPVFNQDPAGSSWLSNNGSRPEREA